MKRLRYTHDGTVARVTLTSANGLNLKDEVLAREFETAVNDVVSDPGIRCLVISAEGENFCAGGDLTTFLGEREQVVTDTRDRASRFHRCLATLIESDVFVITAVHGAVIGGGLSFTFAADYVIGSDDTYLRIPHLQLGLVPDGGITWFLARQIGRLELTRILLTGEAIDATRARDLGMLTEVVPRDDVITRVEGVLATACAIPATALAVTTRLCRTGVAGSLRDQLDCESEAVAAAAVSDEAQRRIARVVR